MSLKVVLLRRCSDIVKYDSNILKNLPPEIFIEVIKTAMWIIDAENHGYELSYNDAELLVFKKLTRQQELEKRDVATN